MQHDWILDVLADLKTFALSNGLPALAEQLDDARIVAMAEQASCTEGTGIGVRGGTAETGHGAQAIGAIRRA
ncbi:MAG: hypothetical protein RID15_00060 [Marinovum algicola]|uniref:hypothetical protein n=1 Tax=Marinovum TaxID=367771 RepID=UPI00065B53D5|nr:MULTISPECIES: hypothetical protein [Marinovum]MDD9741788.1 hypothetical protein [Marinovum sp. SP66]MDD9744662.1 hypothetical protein [Marinovum sp. PR37]